MRINPVRAPGSGAPPTTASGTGTATPVDRAPIAPPKKPIAFLILWFVLPLTLVLIAEATGLPGRLAAVAERLIQTILPF
jgi:hypothetical protein